MAKSRWINNGAFDPLWDVSKIGENKFRLSYQKIPIQDYSLITNSDGKYDGNIKEIKTYGSNYVAKVPHNVRLPIILEMFSRAKDIIDREMAT